MRIHLVAIDLDGTLLNSSKQITDTTAAILRVARETAGLHIVLATARPPRSVMPYYRQLELDTPTINYNGALVYDPPSRRVIMHRPLQADVARAIVTMARQTYPRVLASAEILDRWYTDRFEQEFQTETGRLFHPDVVAPLEQWLTTEVTKLLLLGPPEHLAEIARRVQTDFPHQVTMVRTEETLLQIMHPTVSKAQALRVVAAEMGISQPHVMAIGDNANDVGMLQWAGLSVAVGNASPEVLAAADYVTDHHDSDGAARAIQRLILQGLRG